jgi:hypothetical protein
MNFYFDTEFIEDGRTIDLISIGMCCEDGREIYLVSSEFDESKANEFVREQVLPQLGDGIRHTRREIAQLLREFTLANIPDSNTGAPPADFRPDFWAYYADYDWVALCQLYGRMIDLPSPFPYFCHDLKQLLSQMGVTQLPPQLYTHHALDDAKWVRTMHRWVKTHPDYPFRN